jgi:hypothetical protein
MNALSLPFALTFSMVFMLSGISYAEDNDDTISSSQVQQGFAISPVPEDKLNFTGKRKAAVGLGSYLVNAVGDCSSCHSFPKFLGKGNMAGNNPSAGDPFEGTPSTQSISGRRGDLARCASAEGRIVVQRRDPPVQRSLVISIKTMQTCGVHYAVDAIARSSFAGRKPG